MKHLRPLAYSTLILAALVLMAAPASAQKIAIERVAMSPGMLGTYTGFPVSTGLHVVPIGMKVYLDIDTVGSLGMIQSYTWSFTSAPAGSAAAFADPASAVTTFIPDLTGRYIITMDVGGGLTDSDTLYAGTYTGLPTTGLNCGTCHSGVLAKWAKTRHATMLMRGLTGEIEVEDYNGRLEGAYAGGCFKCHTVGWEPSVDNGNFGFEAKAVGFDTTWYQGLELRNGDYWIPTGDMTIWNAVLTNFPKVAQVATIGCENCHGPGSEHMANGGNKDMIGMSASAGACLTCHNAPKKHRLGSYWMASSHATMPLSKEEAGRANCWPCHNGSALGAFAENPTAPDYSKVDPTLESIACGACHDPHSDENPNQLRTVTFPGLANGFVPAAGVGGKGQLCMNCHRARTNTATVVAAQMNKFGSRFYPHYSPQADMFNGANGYEYGLPITGLATHTGLENGCVTCHMSTRVNGSSVHSNHEMAMVDENGDRIQACQPCHGSFVTSFEDIKAMSDYDGNGTVEAVITEIDGMLAQLKAVLPLDGTGEPVTSAADSMLVTDRATQLPAIYNYFFVKNDWSHGIHNTKYAVALLQASMGRITGVEPMDQAIPEVFQLSQNYPNPFNPSTSIKFSVTRSADVQLLVYNSTGKLIKKLADGHLTSGNYTANWDGRDDNGAAVATGIYFYRLSVVSNGASLYQSTKKMVLAK
ncbi:MAG: FlgD immunoglobulin-like domain containing protein [Bacteroidota bacterium]